MKLPLSWLREYVDIGDITAQELSDKLLSIGFEVEEIIAPRDDIKGVVVGRVESMARHENSDKLWICQINVGKETLQIVTGAQNVSTGDLVPVATVGGMLPGGKKLSAVKLRGVDSYGMLCSGGELCVDNDVIDGAEVDGILILPKDCAVGEDIMHTLGIDDTVLDVSITANRPDCRAVVNLAREIAILLGKPFKMPNLKYKASGSGAIPPVRICNKELCSRYVGRLIEDVTIQKSPKWMRDRLRMCGIRPINNLVDITNYVLLEIGQPLHAFDKRFIVDRVNVRVGGPGEKMTALDGKEYNVEGVLVIADEQKPLAIAGIMGGEYTSIFPDTKDVFLEAARFERSNVRRTSRRIGLRSDSSARFENGVDWQTVDIGSERALALIDELGCGKIRMDKVFDQVDEPVQKTITTSKKQICELLGIDIDKKTIVSILKQQDFGIKVQGENISVTVPLIREDVEDYPDLAEDIMRFYGYDNIVSTHSENTHQTCGEKNIHDRNSELVKERMRAHGADEIFNYSFVSPEAADKLLLCENDPLRNVIKLKNPLSRDISVMRTQLAYSMLSSISRNCSRKNDTLRFYELGKVFIPHSLPLTELPDERDVLCLGICNDGDFYTVKSIVSDIIGIFGQPVYTPCSATYMHPKQSLHVDCCGISGDFGKLHPLVCEGFDLPQNVYIAHLDVTDALASATAPAQYKPISRLQPVDRDLALVVGSDVAVGDMLAAIKTVSPYIAVVKLFDIYQGEQISAGKKSVAFSIRLQPTDRTFTDSDIKEIIDGVLSLAKNKYGAELR